MTRPDLDSPVCKGEISPRYLGAIDVHLVSVNIKPQLRPQEGLEGGVIGDLGCRLTSQGDEVIGEVVGARQLTEFLAGEMGEGGLRWRQQYVWPIFCSSRRR